MKKEKHLGFGALLRLLFVVVFACVVAGGVASTVRSSAAKETIQGGVARNPTVAPGDGPPACAAILA